MSKPKRDVFAFLSVIIRCACKDIRNAIFSEKITSEDKVENYACVTATERFYGEIVKRKTVHFGCCSLGVSFAFAAFPFFKPER